MCIQYSCSPCQHGDVNGVLSVGNELLVHDEADKHLLHESASELVVHGTEDDGLLRHWVADELVLLVVHGAVQRLPIGFVI